MEAARQRRAGLKKRCMKKPYLSDLLATTPLIQSLLPDPVSAVLADEGMLRVFD